MKNLEEFKRICAGPVWDGDVISKDGRDELVKAGFVARRNGWNLLSVDGVDVAVAFGLLSTNPPTEEKNFVNAKAAAVARKLGFLPEAAPCTRELQDRVFCRLSEKVFSHMEEARNLLHGLSVAIDVSEKEAAAFEVGMPYAFGTLSAWVDSAHEVNPGLVRVIFVLRRRRSP